MQAEEALQLTIANPSLLVVTGSRLYGTERYNEFGKCISDTDKRGVILPPWEYIISRDFEQAAIPGEQDGLIYSLKFFIKHLVACNPQYLEVLFANDKNILKCDEIGKTLMGMRNLFVCKRFYNRIVGFSSSEWRKCKAKEVINNNTISVNRRKEFEKYGYVVSSACHSIRLLRQCTELLLHGTMTFPRPDAEQLRSIKNGQVSFEELEKIYNEASKECESAIVTSVLPERPNEKAIREIYENITIKYLFQDNRCFSRAKALIVGDIDYSGKANPNICNGL